MKNFTIPLSFLLLSVISYAQTGAEHVFLTDHCIRSEERNLSLLDNGEATDLPLGIYKDIGGQHYILGIDSLVLKPGGSYLCGIMAVDIPVVNDKIAFSGSKMRIRPDGMEDASASRLLLAADIPIRLSDKLKLTLKGSERKTYVEFDCNGYVGMGLQGEFEFCREFLIPEMPDGSEAPEPARVRAQFETQMSGWGNLMAKVSITPFQVPGLKGFGFYVQDAWVDQSEVSNPSGMLFPAGYQSPYFLEGNTNLWQGFFLRQVSVKLPAQFNSRGSQLRKEIGAANVLIDNMGFSGTVFARNIIPFEEGNMSGWAYSLDELAITLTTNKLSGAGFKGHINLPITKEDKKLGYTAIISEGGNYFFNIESCQNMEVPLWGATMNIHPTSSIHIIYANKEFIPGAVLHGNISLRPDLGTGGDKGEFHGITFEDMRLSGVKPHIVPGSFGIESRNNKMAGFSLTINNIGIITRGEEIGLHFDLSLHLMKDSDGGFSGKTGINVFGRMEESETGRQRWKYSKTEIDRILINVNGGVYSIAGELNLYKKDPVFGSGFRGMVHASFVPGLSVTATAQFGNINDLRYWYVDAFTKMPSGIPIMPGFGLYGFGGGMYHHMKRNTGTTSANPEQAPVPSEIVPVSGVTEIRPAPSGAAYIPDANTHLGLKAMVMAGTHSNPDAFNADATFEIVFNKSGGVNYIGFYGTGYFMSSPDNRKDNVPVKADVNISMDFVNKVLHGNFEVFVSVAGAIRGIHANNLAGGAVIHFERNEWYINIGTPYSRLGVSLAGLAQATAYFMAGTNIPGMPPPPQHISDILGGKDLNFMRDENALGKGGGFCFGASLDVNTGRKQFLIFYGQFAAGAGFDIMLKNYGSDVRCEGRSGTIGMNGWYASGQAYAYLQGEIGIKVDLVFASGEYKILEIGAAAVLQAKLPNPTWLEGNVGGHYSILNDKIKGQCCFTLTIGEQCRLTGGSAISGMKVIAGLSPATGEGNVNVFNNPQAAFTLPVDKSFELEESDGSIKSFRVRLAYFQAMKGSNAIPGHIEWNEQKDVAAFVPADILPGKSQINISVKIFFEELHNNIWRPVIVNKKPAEEISEISFTTGEAPDYIPLSNVKYSYPQISQCHFLKGEYGQGYIQLIKGQDELFEAGPKWVQKLRFMETETSVYLESDFNYNTEANQISFAIPNTLKNEKIYALEVVNIPANKISEIDNNVRNITASLSSAEGADVNLETKTLEGTLDKAQEKNIFSAHFKTSRYNTLAEKLRAMNISQGWSYPIFEYNGLHELGASLSGNEAFDMFEISGTNYTKRLIDFEASVNNSWYSHKIFPLLYQVYPLENSIAITWRNQDEPGTPPLKAITLRQTPHNKTLTEAEVKSGMAGRIADYSNIIYNLPFYMYKDYADLQSQCALLLTRTNNVSKQVTDLVSKPFPGISTGNYEVYIKYTLPGTGIITSTYKIVIKNL